MQIKPRNSVKLEHYRSSMDSYYVPLNELQLEKVKKELNVDDDVKFEHTLALFEEWVSYQKYLPQNYDRVLLKTYLRLCKHDLEKAKIKFKNYLINVSKLSQLFQNRILSLEPKYNISRYMHVYPLPEATPDGYRVFLTKIFNPDPSIIDLQRIMQRLTMYVDYRMHRDEVSAGDVFVSDLELLHGGHMPVFLNTTVKKLLDLAMESYPLRIKGIHVVASAPIVTHGINIFKTFLKEDLRSKLYVHKSMESVAQHVPLRCLPSDYGGAQKSLAELSAENTKVLKSARHVFEHVESLKIVGAVPEEVDTTSTLEFGVEGSFRQLDVD